MYWGTALPVVLLKYLWSPYVIGQTIIFLKVFYDAFTRISQLATRHNFVFKKNSSCAHTLLTVNDSIKYFTKKGSKVRCGFLDASEAFDKVLHHGTCWDPV